MKIQTNNLSKAQRKANARNQLFRQIHGFSLNSFIDRAVKEQAITIKEVDVLHQICMKLDFLKRHQFEGSKEVGLNPRRRCAICKNIAHWKITILGEEKYYCNKHKKEIEIDNKQNNNKEWLITNIKEIKPYE